MEKNGEPSVKRPSPTVDFTAGVISGAAGLVVGQPFDVVKVRSQIGQVSRRQGSTFGALRLIMENEGTRGLFKGVMSPMAGIAFINGIVFTSYSFFMNLQHPPHSPAEPSLTKVMLAGAGSGVLAAFITCPTELIKVRQQSAPVHLNPSTLDVVKDIVGRQGVRGLYRGFTSTVTRDIAYGPYFCTYEAMCRFFKSLRPPVAASASDKHVDHGNLIEEAQDEMGRLTWPELMVSGGVAGVTAWLVTFPIDVIKTRIQGDVQFHRPTPSMAQVARKAVRQTGWKTLFAGLGPTLIRAVPTNMVIFLTFEGIIAAAT